MAQKYTILHRALIDLRSMLQARMKQDGEDKHICSDEALLEMSKKRPTRLSDFLAIPGLDHDFLDRYSHLFLDLILTYTKQDTKPIKVSKHASIVLDKYKDRLTDISKTNPHLYMGKIEKIRNYDLYHVEMDEMMKFLSGHKDFFIFDTSKDETYQHLTTLYRSINKDQKDNGTYQLYIAYPYVEGIYLKEQFPIKAPPCLYASSFRKKQKSYKLISDKNKDILLNRDLLLMITKMEKSHLLNDAPEINDLSFNTVKHIIIPFMKPMDFM